MTTAEAGRPFVIVASQRTGSTVLVRSLDAAPGIFCAGELFHGGPRVFHREYRYAGASRIRDLLLRIGPAAYERWSIRRHLERYFAAAGGGVQAVGFKAMVSQLRRYGALLPALLSLNASLLFLYRQDSFATALSFARAKASGIYHSDRADGSSSSASIRLDAGEFRRLLERCEAEKEAILGMHRTYGGTLLVYEEMSSRWDEFIGSVGVALGIPDLKLVAALDRLSDARRSIRVENEGELRLAHAGRANDADSIAAC